MASVQFQNVLPVIDINDSNDQGIVQVHISGYDAADASFEADVVSYIKGRIASVPSTGTTAAVKVSLNTASI